MAGRSGLINRRSFLIGATTAVATFAPKVSFPNASSLVLLRSALADRTRSVRLRLIGDSITWGLNASGTLDYVSPKANPRQRLLTDERAPLDAPSYANLLRAWLADTYYPSGNQREIRGGAVYAKGDRIFEFVNDGIIGTTSDRWLPTGLLLNDGKQYDFVICMLGTNDRGADTRLPHSPSRTTANLLAIIDHIEASGSAVILATPNAVSPDRDAFGAPKIYAFSQAEAALAIRSVANSRPTVDLVDCYRVTAALSRGRLLDDGLQPSDYGHAVIFAEFRKSIAGARL